MVNWAVWPMVLCESSRGDTEDEGCHIVSVIAAVTRSFTLNSCPPPLPLLHLGQFTSTLQ